ncbi:MAG TPA: thioredoxin domain-containing protein [Ardenticatenaceae bacterium]
MSRVQAKTREGAVEARPGSQRTLLLGGLMVALLAFVGVLVLIGQRGSRGPNTEQYENVQAEGRVLGSPEAPLLIQEYADFRCPHCRDASVQTTPSLIETYVVNNQVRFEIIPVGILGPESVLAAEAALCAEAQGRFWAYHDLLFARQGTMSYTQDSLISLADGAGVNQQEFRDCLLSGRMRSVVQANNNAFQAAGATGTPAYIVGDQLVEGAVPFNQMQPIIEGQLGG